MGLIDSSKSASFLEDNAISFLRRGIYEAALFEAMTSGCHCLPERWNDLVFFADREKLRLVGDPIPTKPVTVYRGVACCSGVVDTSGNVYYGEEEPDDVDIAYDLGDFVEGYSWTLNKHTAAWFSDRLPNRTENLPGRGTVFYVRIKPEDILFCTNHRGEEEVVVDIHNLGCLRFFKKTPKPIFPGSTGSIAA